MTPRGDFLDYLRTVQEKSPERLTDRDISTALLSNLLVLWNNFKKSLLTPKYRFAGSDTVAMALRAIFYFLVKHPTVYHKLTHEIDRAEERGELSKLVEFQQGLKLKYLYV